jgi:hypothetical protein
MHKTLRSVKHSLMVDAKKALGYGPHESVSHEDMRVLRKEYIRKLGNTRKQMLQYEQRNKRLSEVL